MVSSKRDIGRRIRVVRTSLGLNQDKFGERLGGLKKRAISAYESGDNAPSSETLARIAKLGKSTLDWLITGYGVGPDGYHQVAEEESTYGAQPASETLSMVIEAVEEHLQNNDLQLPPAKKAELITLLCEMVQEEGAEKVDQTTVAKLIKLAS